VGDLLLAGDPATLVEDLARVAVDAIEMRDTWRAMYGGATARLHAATVEMGRLRQARRAQTMRWRTAA
jgi:hypothetical protein